MYNDDYLTTRYGYVYGQDKPASSYEESSTGLPRTARKLAIVRLEQAVLDWMDTYGDHFPDLRDDLHQISVHIDRERDTL